jgi:glutaredoxin-like YruB-family protein
MERIETLDHMKEVLARRDQAFVLIYKKGMEQSECAFKNLESALIAETRSKVFVVDTNLTRDIHPAFGVTTAPTLLSFEKDILIGEIKGCHDATFYRSLLNQYNFTQPAKEGEKKSAKSVVVYSTPTCSWCNTLKSWLRKNQIAFREVNVAADQHAAEAMVRKSGQQGVPQTEINGQIVVGFDQNRLKNLLGINS